MKKLSPQILMLKLIYTSKDGLNTRELSNLSGMDMNNVKGNGIHLLRRGLVVKRVEVKNDERNLKRRMSFYTIRPKAESKVKYLFKLHGVRYDN